jgi:hypothetical protein
MKGSTLIETVLYIALLSILLTGSITTSFQLLKSANTDTTQLESYDETVFVFQKIAWALSQSPNQAHVLSPNTRAHSDLLSLLSPHGYIALCVYNHELRIYEGYRPTPSCDDAAFTPLTRSLTNASNFDIFIDSGHIARLSLTLNTTTYTTTAYIP